MSEQHLAGRLAALTVVAQEQLPDAVASSVEQRVLDVLGLCVAASTLDTSRAVAGMVSRQQCAPVSTAVCLGGTSPAWAAFVNGTLSHSLDFDDTHLPSVLHPSSGVIPAVLAAAERENATGERLVPAIAAGLEICVRLGMAGYDHDQGTSVYFEHGQHATSICSAVAAAAASAALHGPAPDPRLVTHAMAIAVSMASGVIEANRTGGTVKRIHNGWAAHAGVTAAELAVAGITGPPTALEGRFGFFQAFLRGEFDRAGMMDGLGTDWEVPGIFFKPYPANHFTHTVIDAARQLRTAGLTPEQVESVHVGVPTSVVRTIGEPLEVKQSPATGYQAQFSGPYAFTVGLLGGGGLGAALSDFTDELAQDPVRRALMRRVTVGGDDRCDKVFPYQFPSVVTVQTTDGRELVESVMVNRGGPDNPLSDAELAQKFSDNATTVLSPSAAAHLQSRVLSLRSEHDLRGLMSLLAKPEGGSS